MRLFEIETELTFKDTCDGSYSGQIDCTIYAYMNDQLVGRLSYSVYKGNPSIKMIEVGIKRQKIATKMLQRLQSLYPDVEIEWGMLTDDGAKLKSAVKTRSIPNLEVQEKVKELKILKDKLKHYENLYKDFQSIKFPTEEERQKFFSLVSDWNEIDDRIWELEQDLRDQKEETVLIQ